MPVVDSFTLAHLTAWAKNNPQYGEHYTETARKCWKYLALLDEAERAEALNEPWGNIYRAADAMGISGRLGE